MRWWVLSYIFIAATELACNEVGPRGGISPPTQAQKDAGGVILAPDSGCRVDDSAACVRWNDDHPGDPPVPEAHGYRECEAIPGRVESGGCAMFWSEDAGGLYCCE